MLGRLLVLGVIDFIGDSEELGVGEVIYIVGVGYWGNCICCMGLELEELCMFRELGFGDVIML